MWTDLLHALRSLRKSPALAAIAIGSLALGLGADVTVYSVVRELILDDLSARQPDRLARVDAGVSDARYRDLRDSGVFQDLAFESGLGNVAWQAATHSEVVWRMTTSANFFDVLGVGASSGRLYSQADDGLPVAVISNGFWRNRLNADPAAAGRTLAVDGKLYTLLGVLPRDYRSIRGHGISPEVYVIGHPSSDSCRLFGRLRDGLTRAQTQQALLAAARAIGGEESAKRIAILRPMGGFAAHASGEGDNRRFFLFFVMLLATAGMLALIACLNVAGLLVARSVARQRELAIRQALGANRWQMVRQLLAEGLVLVIFGAGAGLMFDAAVRDRLSYLRWPSAYNLPIEFHFQGDRGLFLYALAIALAALLVSSLIPALRGSLPSMNLAMKQSAPVLSIRRWNVRNYFVTLQVALSTVLLLVAVLFLRSFFQIAHTGAGFDSAHTLIAQVHLADRSWHLRDEAVRTLVGVPGVVGVTSIGTLPLMGELPRTPMRRIDQAAASAREVYSIGAGEQFCKVMGIELLRGRDFEIADRTRQPEPALVNQTLARQWFADADPVGASIMAGDRVLEIVGVTGDAKMRTLGEDHTPLIFTPYSEAQMIVRVAGNPPQWVKPLEHVLGEFDPAAALDIRPLSDATAGATFPMRVAAAFVGSLSCLGLVLALCGLYASVSHATRGRTREMAIRAAVGANRGRIIWTALRDGFTVLACGVALGIPVAVVATRLLTSIVPDGVDPWNRAVIASVVLSLIAAGAIAAWIPARGAANVDPSQALREE